MTERDDREIQDAAGDLRHRSLYKSREWLKEEASDNRSDDTLFSPKSMEESQQLDTLRDAIGVFFEMHCPTFQRTSQDIEKFQEGLRSLSGGKDEVCKLLDTALIDLLKALREKLVNMVERPWDYKREVETQLPTSGTSLSNELRFLSQRARAAAQRSVAKAEESLSKSAEDTTPGLSMQESCFRDLESIYQGHRAEHKLAVDAIKRQCPSDVAESLNALNRFMASEAGSRVLAISEVVRETLIAPIGIILTDLQVLDNAMGQLAELNSSAKCIRAGGEVARLAVQSLITEQLRISRAAVNPRIGLE